MPGSMPGRHEIFNGQSVWHGKKQKRGIIHTMLCGQPPRQVLAYVYDWYGYLTGQILLSP